jgi:hypothetical protein
MTLDEVLADPPLVHVDGAGNVVSWPLGPGALRVIEEHIGPGSRTLETGEGMSTVLFALRGAEHVCVTPNRDAVTKIIQYCVAHGVSLDRVRFEIGCSEEVLPRLELGELDLVLIDGRHGFPAPFIDWHYTAGALRVGGLVIVDDTQLWTGSILKRFLDEEPEWKLVHDFSPRTAVFRLQRAGNHAKEWIHQPFVACRRGETGPSLVSVALEKSRRGFAMLRRGEYRNAAGRLSDLLRRR